MQIINNLHYITRKEITGLEPSKCDCLLVLQFDFKISSDLYRDNYFNQLLALIVEHDLEIDLLITHSDDTTNLSAHQMCVATLPEYKKVIVSGSTPLKLLFNYEFIQPYTSFMRQGLEIGAKDFLYYPYDTKCYLIDSHRECFYKSQIAKYVAQIENAVGKILDSESLSRLESSNILPIYDMLTLLPELEGKMLGFDYETNGLSGTPDLRLTGIGLSTDTDGYFFYFSEDREEYQLEFELIKPVFIDFLNRNYKNVIVYNSKFESIVTERLFDGNLYEFQDALPLCLAMQSPGTLKKNASAYLGVPLWNEETTDIISKYESVNKLLKQSDRDEMKVLGKDNYKTLPALSTVCDVTQTTKPIVILQTGEEVLYKLGTNARTKKTLPISIPLELNPDNRDKIVEVFIPEFLKENVKKEVTYKITSISSPEEMEILEVVKKKKKKKKDETDSPDTENEDKPKVLGYQITLELEVNQVKELSQLESIYGEKLFKYLSEGYTGWEVCDRHTLGKYCILDAFYSLQLYNRFYPKLKKSYHIYRGQMFISGLMEKYGFSVDKDLYYYFLDYYTKHGTEIFKSLLTTSSVLDNIIEKEYEAECLKVSIDALEDILKDKFPEMKPTKRMRTSIVENSMLEENDYNQLKRGYLEIMPVLQENPESFKLALPQLLRELRTQALDIAKARVSRNVIAQAVKGEIDMAKDLHELKPLCNLNSNTEEHSSRVWGAIMDSTFESVFPLFKLAEKVDYYFTLMKLNPGRVKNEGELRELLNRIKETSGYSKLYSTADMYEQVTTKRFDSAELSIFSDMQFVYKSAITRAKFLKENGRNNTDINEMLGVYKMFFLPDGKTMDDVDDYTDNIKVLYKYLQMKKIFKAITTYIDGSSGSGSMSVVDYSNYSRIRDFSVEGDRDKDIDLLLNTDFYANYKDTLRWGSGMHTLPKLMECTGMLSVRDKDNVLIGFDAAQSEVRVIATIANDTGMLESLRRGEDIHRANAARLFKCKPEEVTKLQRDAAKSAITFGLLYGKSAEALARDNFNGDINYANSVNEALFREMKQIKEWMDNKHKEVRDRNGKVFMDLFEHDLFVGIPSETSKECERRSVNYPIQSLSSSLNGYFGYLLHKEASRQGILNYPLSFVHDAWIFEIPMKYLFNFLELVKYYFKTYPDQQIGLPADCDFDISVNKYMPKEITYELVDNPGEINKTTVKFKTKIVMIHKNRYLYESFLKNLPNCRITHEEVSEEILDSQKLSDLPNPKCSWGVHLGKPVKIVKIEGECDYIPLEKSSGYSNGLFQDDALHLNTTHLLSVVNHRNDNEIEE